MNIRLATPDDAKALLAIYAPYVTDTAITFEIAVPTPEDFRSRITETLRKFPYLVAEEDGRLLGYAYAGTFRKRAAFNHCVEMSIYIDRDCRWHGIGSMLYEELEKRLMAMGIINLCASIATAVNDPYITNQSELFHQRHGYVKVAHFHKCGYKFNRWYDMIWMEKLLK